MALQNFGSFGQGKKSSKAFYEKFHGDCNVMKFGYELMSESLPQYLGLAPQAVHQSKKIKKDEAEARLVICGLNPQIKKWKR